MTFLLIQIVQDNAMNTSSEKRKFGTKNKITLSRVKVEAPYTNANSSLTTRSHKHQTTKQQRAYKAINIFIPPAHRIKLNLPILHPIAFDYCREKMDSIQLWRSTPALPTSNMTHQIYPIYVYIRSHSKDKYKNLVYFYSKHHSFQISLK